MAVSFHEIIHDHCRPMAPIPTGECPVLHLLEDVQAVLFDIYGTLLISGSGDFAMSGDQLAESAIAEALGEAGIPLRGHTSRAATYLKDEIRTDHARLHHQGIKYPEVDIVDVWRRVMTRLIDKKLVGRIPKSMASTTDGKLCLHEQALQRISLLYELKANPVWAMPNARQCLVDLFRRGMVLGVISNAQFMTIELWKTLLRIESEECEFVEELQFYSYVHGEAKPGLKMFQLAREALTRQGIPADKTVYIGNDLLNDVLPASEVGFRTVLFAGDARSLRWRRGEPRVAGVAPDLVIDDLADLYKCIVSNS